MQTRSLGLPDVQQARQTQRFAFHIAPLNAWIDRLNAERDGGRWMPYFDPESGGVNTQLLLLMESPGPAVSRTQFVSLDNPDATAENLALLLHLAGLPRREVTIWNAVPWQMSAGGVVAPVPAQHAEAAPLTRHVLSLMPDLRAVVLVGRHAQTAWRHVGSSLPTFACPHPSPQNFHTRRDEAGRALNALLEARRAIKNPPLGR